MQIRKQHRTICNAAAALCIACVLMTGCGSSDSFSADTDQTAVSIAADLSEKGLTPNQVSAVDKLGDGYVKQLLNTPCQQVNMEFVDKIITDIFDSDALAKISYETMFDQSSTVDIAGVLKFGHKPFYLHKDLQADTVEIRWSPDSVKAVGTDFERFYKITNNYTDASRSVYYDLCDRYLTDGYTMILEAGGSKMEITNIEMVKTYIESRGSLDLDEISVYRLDADGHEDLRIKYETDTGIIKIMSWEPDRINLNKDEMPVNPAITDVRFTEISLPFMDYSKRSVVPANLPINGVTMTYGHDADGKYVGRIDFEFIANEDQAAQLAQFYAKYYSKAKLEENMIAIDTDYTVTFMARDDMYKIIVVCRDNFEQ